MGGWGPENPYGVRIEKSVRIIGPSLNTLILYDYSVFENTILEYSPEKSGTIIKINMSFNATCDSLLQVHVSATGPHSHMLVIASLRPLAPTGCSCMMLRAAQLLTPSHGALHSDMVGTPCHICADTQTVSV